jgi:hypothetical protein
MRRGICYLAGISVFASGLWGQAAPPRSQIAGKVTAVDAAAGQISFQSAQGEALKAAMTERTQILHALPGENDPKKWTRMAVGEISVGDQILVYYRGAADQKPLPATTVVVRTKADLSTLAQKELEDWKKRGSSGTAVSVDPATNTIVLKSGPRTLTVHASDKTVSRRYSPDSARPADAKPATLAELKPGDQVNVLGNRSEDGVIQAETVYFGTFRQIAATINSVDAAKGELSVTDLATKKPMTIVVPADAVMKKLPEMLAAGLARRYQGGGRGSPEGRSSDGGGRGPEGSAGRGGRGGDIGAMIDRLPAIALADLKPKDAIMVSTTSGSDPSRVSAITLLAGVEPVLTAAPSATRDIMSGWNLNGGGGAENQ